MRALALKFTPDNTDDRTPALDLARDLAGIFVADAGYVSEPLERAFFREGKRLLLIAPRVNMRKLATRFQGALLKTRMLVERSFRCLKMFHGFVSSLPRSIDGYFSNYASSLLAYVLV